MSWLARTFKQVYGLFVEDGLLSASIVVWLLVAAFVLTRVGPVEVRPIIVFLGLALALIDSVRRSAKAQSQ